MPQPLLHGEVEAEYVDVTPTVESEIETLRAEVAELHDEVALIKGVLMRMYGAFKSSLGDQTAVSTDAGDKWGQIKQRMAPRLREAIDLLLLQGQMKRTQIASALKMDYSNCTKNVIGVLKAQGWIVESNGYLSLKQL